MNMDMNSTCSSPIRPVATLGMLGGGQLGRMFVHAAQKMGYRTVVLEPDVDSPAGRASDLHLVQNYTDATAWVQLSQTCQAITTEFENVPALALSTLAAHCTVSPPASAVAIAQDRIQEKMHLKKVADVAPYCVLYGDFTPITHQEKTEATRNLNSNVANAIASANIPSDFFPAILKTARMGYDGKGQIRIHQAQDLAAGWKTLGFATCVLEKMLALQAEYSVIVARGWDGECVHFPLQRNIHVDGILAQTHVYTDDQHTEKSENIPVGFKNQAIQTAKNIAISLNYVGVLCVEFFAVCRQNDQQGHQLQWLVNEIAPRPHNSGHYTMDACDSSQFDLQLRTLCRLPLVQPTQHSDAIMLNLLGDVWLTHNMEPPWEKLLSISGVHLHLYGKKVAKAGRKMGHITLTAPSVVAVQSLLAQVEAVLCLKRVN